MSSLGKRIKKIREERGLNQEAFSKDLGISRTGLAKLELGEQSNPGAQLIAKLVELGYNANWLLSGKGHVHYKESDIQYDRELLTNACSIIEKILSRQELKIDWSDKGKVIARFYEHLIKYNINANQLDIIEKEGIELIDFISIRK
jgi:transcriptional regulator with XRE-family HTH domain